ncbi:MAG TPA: hypothetical protein VFK00_02155, partial [Rhodanobacteraceae bacterium]|nr:hypothetical protein [Rhodanobacteraceae bacterium]
PIARIGGRSLGFASLSTNLQKHSDGACYTAFVGWVDPGLCPGEAQQGVVNRLLESVGDRWASLRSAPTYKSIPTAPATQLS